MALNFNGIRTEVSGPKKIKLGEICQFSDERTGTKINPRITRITRSHYGDTIVGKWLDHVVVIKGYLKGHGKMTIHKKEYPFVGDENLRRLIPH